MASNCRGLFFGALALSLTGLLNGCGGGGGGPSSSGVSAFIPSGISDNNVGAPPNGGVPTGTDNGGNQRQLRFITQPPATVTDFIPIAPAIQVAVEDPVGNIDPTATDAVTLGFGVFSTTPTQTPTLLGSVTVNAVNGVATFSNLGVDIAGNSAALTGVTLLATATGDQPSSNSSAFSVNLLTTSVAQAINSTPVAGTGPTAVTVGSLRNNGLLDVVAANTATDTVSVYLANPDGTYPATASSTVTVGNGPSSVVLVDLTGHGVLDMAVANQTDGTISLFQGNGDGTFTSQTTIPAGTGGLSSPVALTAISFNTSDAVPGLAAANFSGGVSVFINNGTFGFTAATGSPLAVGTTPSAIAAANLNGNSSGNQDLVVANQGSNNISVLVGNGDGTFAAAVNTPVGTAPDAVAVGNLNGKLGVVVANSGSNNVSVLTGNGATPLALTAQPNVTVGTKPTGIALADVTGTGHLDIITSNATSNNVSLAVGTGTGTFGAASTLPLATRVTGGSPATGPAAVVAAALNSKSGRIDLVTANQTSNNISVLFGVGQPFYAAPKTVTAGTGPQSLAAGDFALTGNPGLVVANETSNTASVSIYTASTKTFGAATTVNLGTGTAPVSVAVADFNQDGDPGFVTANSGSANVSVVLGNGDGTFQTPINVAVGTVGTNTPSFVTTAQLSGSGFPDLIVADSMAGQVWVLLGQGNGTFGAPQGYTVGTNPVWIAVADYNGDGKLDLAVANSGSNNVSILLGNGDGTFQPASNVSVGTTPLSVAAAKLTLTSPVDLVTANSGSNNVSVLFGNGDGTFQAQQTFPAGLSPQTVVVADYNADGIPDIVVSDAGSGLVSLLQGNGVINSAGVISGGLSWQLPIYLPTTSAGGLLTASFNNNGKNDVAVANSNGGNVMVFLHN